MKDTILKEIFEKQNDLFYERETQYGNAFANKNNHVRSFFPKGITLKSDEDFRRYAIFSLIIMKLSRYSENFSKSHDDSMSDASVYCNMLHYIDTLEDEGEKDNINE